MHRESPLQHASKPGRFGLAGGAPGVTFTMLHPVTLVSVIARKGKAKAVKDALSALRGSAVMWAGLIWDTEDYVHQG